jgi:hypothetical protein
LARRFGLSPGGPALTSADAGVAPATAAELAAMG